MATAFVMTGYAQTEASPEQKPTTSEAAPEDDKPTTTISGSADTYYRYDFYKTKSNNFTSFTNSHNSIELGMASVKIDHKRGKVNMVADLGFGKRAQEFAYNDEGVVSAIKQLYVSYAPAEWIKFTAGSWATHLGYELVDPQLNRNYSMSYMFTNGPFTHTGLKADFTAGKHGFMLGVANPTDYRTAPEEGLNKKHFIGQYSIAFTENTKAYVNFVAGKAPDSSKANQIDLVLTTKISDKFSLGYNGTVANYKFKQANGNKYLASQNWWGSALYVNVDPVSWFGLTLRGEYFSDKDMIKVYSSEPKGGSIFATTLSANFKVNSFIIIPEFRVDNASENIFTDTNGSKKSTAGNFLLAAVYSF